MNPFREGILNALFSGAIKQGEELYLGITPNRVITHYQLRTNIECIVSLFDGLHNPVAHLGVTVIALGEPVALSRVPVNMRTDGDKIVIEFEPGNVPGHIVEWYDEAMLSRL